VVRRCETERGAHEGETEAGGAVEKDMADVCYLRTICNISAMYNYRYAVIITFIRLAVDRTRR
jgi:hypothetical protein